VLDLISRLVDKSLVLLDDTTGHYRLLETIRQFSVDRLREAGELAATRDRHTAWFAEWCESLGRGEHDFDIGPTHAHRPRAMPDQPRSARLPARPPCDPAARRWPAR
jgi:hypothetical protein